MINADAPNSDLAERLPFCPRCRYPFSGLPKAHQCPECGLAYDADSRMWKTPQYELLKGRSSVLFIGIVNLVIGGMIILQGIFRSGTLFRVIFLVGGTLNLAAGVLTWRRWLRYADLPPSFVAVLPDGLWFTGLFDRARSIAWERISSVREQSVTPGIHAIRIHLRPKGQVLANGGCLSSVEMYDVIARIMTRVEKLAA